MARWHSCNVLEVGASAHRVWQFDARSNGFTLNREQSVPAGESLPAGMVGKTWQSLWQPKLNVAWLPPDSVFLRVVHLPAGSSDETLSMVELQLEKLSPIPVTQVVWSVQSVPRVARESQSGGTEAGGLQALIVVLAERKRVEEFLGQLEGQGYLADRLELPVLDQLQATTVNEDGAWIYPDAWGGNHTAMVAWWYGGVLQNLNFVLLPAVGDRAANLKEQLTQMAWAGELEGWLTAPPKWHLVTDKASAAEWEPALRQSLDEPIAVSPTLAPAELAGLTAKRAARGESKASLMPAEFATRYHQQFVDRLWMRGLFAVAALYGVGVAIYFVALGFLNVQTARAEDQVKALGVTYTNTLRLQAQYQVLKDRQDLKFAALDCWKAVADLTPASITLEGFSFSDGKTLRLNGTAPANGKEVIDFTAALKKATVGPQQQPLFDQTYPDQFESHAIGDKANWSFVLQLKRGEQQ